jgi:hypothetical protein
MNPSDVPSWLHEGQARGLATPQGSGPPPQPPPRRLRGWLLALVGIGLALALVAGLLSLRPSAGLLPPARTSSTATPSRFGDPARQVRQVLALRARAILRHDRPGFLASVDSRRAGFYRAQAALFDRMVTAPFSGFSYQLDNPANLATPRIRRRYAPAPVYLPEVEASYHFRGQDASPVLARFYYTFVWTGSAWRIAAQDELRPAFQSDAEIWDFGPLQTVATSRTLVVFHPGDGLLAGRLLATAERGYAQVAASWSGPWEHKVVILVPRDQDEAERLVGAHDLGQVAAVAASSIESGPFQRVLGNRIVVNSSNVRRYDQLNLQVVITHEMTHVATRTLGQGVPLFIVEGFADFTALRPIAQPLAFTRPALAAAVRAGRFTGALPSDADLRGPSASVAYDASSSFCLWVASTFGEARLQALYRAFRGAVEPGIGGQDVTFRRVLGVSRATAQARWAAWVRRVL